MFASLSIFLALAQQPEPDSAFVGTWELTALSTAGLPRPGAGSLIVTQGAPGRPVQWFWDIPNLKQGPLEVTRTPGKPWPFIRCRSHHHMKGSNIDVRRDGVYHLEGDLLVFSFSEKPITDSGEGAFQPAPRRTVETYRRVRREADPSFRPAPFPKGSPKLIATWDEAWHSLGPGSPYGILAHHAIYDLGEGVRKDEIRTEFLDDPPGSSFAGVDVPTGTLVHPAGAKLDPKTNDLSYPDSTPEVKEIIDAFRDQSPEPPERKLNSDLFSEAGRRSKAADEQFMGWDGILLATRVDGGRMIAEVLFRPRVVSRNPQGKRIWVNYGRRILETWEYRDGRLRYLGGGPLL